MRKLSAFFTGLTLGVVGACNATPRKDGPPPIQGNDCIFFRALYDWQPLDDHNMVIWETSREAYQLYFLTPLVGLNFNIRLAFVDKDRDGRLCGFSRDEIAVTDHSFPQRATISAMKHLDGNDIAKLEEHYKVKLTRGSKKQKPNEPDRQTAQ